MQKNLSHFLITGANGFIGNRLCAHLKNLGLTVTAVLKNNPTDLKSNLWDQIIIHDFNSNNNFAEHLPNLTNKKIDAIIHLANIAHTNANITFEEYWKVNVTSTLDLLDFALLTDTKAFLYLSSIKAARSPQQNVCVDETFDAWPEQQDFYGITKRISENLLQRSINHNNLHLSILRPSLVYGPNVKGHLNLLIKAAQKHLLPNLPETNNKQSMVHIDDLIQAMLLAINNPAANKQIFIVSDNKEYSTKQIFEHIKNQIPNNTFWAWVSRITIPYWLLKIIAKCVDFLQLLLNNKLDNKFYFNSKILEKLLGSSCFHSKKIQVALNWQPKYTFFDTKI